METVKKKILVIDDEQANLGLFQVMLSNLGYVVEEASDGKEGLEKIKKSIPDLILMDNVMPKMTGWELTKILKADEKFKNIPIIMLSEMNDVKDKVGGFELGIDDYIVKPFNFTEVLARMKVILRTYELIKQIAARESRLSLAEKMGANIISTIEDLSACVDKLESSITGADKCPGVPESLKNIRKDIGEIESRIKETFTEWDAIKKNEIGLSALEKHNTSENPEKTGQA